MNWDGRGQNSLKFATIVPRHTAVSSSQKFLISKLHRSPPIHNPCLKIVGHEKIGALRSPRIVERRVPRSYEKELSTMKSIAPRKGKSVDDPWQSMKVCLELTGLPTSGSPGPANRAHRRKGG